MLKRFGVPLTRVLSIRSLASGIGRSEERKPFTRVMSVRSLNSAGNGESEEPNNGGQESDPSWRSSSQQHLDRLLNECKEWERRSMSAKQTVIAQYEQLQGGKELILRSEIPSLERFVKFLKRDAFYWWNLGNDLDSEKCYQVSKVAKEAMNSVLVWYEQNGTGPDQETVRVYIEDALFQELNMTLSQSLSHWIQQSDYWAGWAQSLGVETATGKSTVDDLDEDLDGVISEISQQVKDLMTKVLVWRNIGGRIRGEMTNIEICKTLFSEIGLTQEEAFDHWNDELYAWSQTWTECEELTQSVIDGR